MARWRVDPTRLICPYTHRAGVMISTPTPHTYTLTQEHGNAKQERESAGERKNNFVQERGNSKRERKIEECGHWGREAFQERATFSGTYILKRTRIPAPLPRS